MNQLTKPSHLLWASLGMGFLASSFFFGVPMGVSSIWLACILIASLIYFVRCTNGRLSRHTYWLFVPLLFAACMLVIRTNTVLTLLNMLVYGYSLMLIATFAQTNDDVTRPGVVEYLSIPIRVFVRGLELPYLFLRDHIDFQALHQRNQYTIYPVARGVMIATPILIILVALLASADLIFANYLREILAIEWHIDFVKLASQILFGFVFAWLIAGWLLYSIREDATAVVNQPHRLLQTLSDRYPLGFLETATVLILINVVFSAFVLIQFVYIMDEIETLFAGQLSYAEYARQGFFELLLISIVVLGLILAFHWFTKRDAPLHASIFNGLCTLKAVLVLVMLTSAYKRLSLYERYFGFTEWRVYGRVLMIWLGVLLIWFAIALWIQPRRLAVGGLMVGFGFIVTLNLLNPDAFVVRQNMARYQTVGYVDIDYLTSLSADATSELIVAYQTIEAEPEVVYTQNCLWHVATQREHDRFVPCIETSSPDNLGATLHAQYNSLHNTAELWEWHTFHYGRWQAYQALR